jgi:hypothetical protein
MSTSKPSAARGLRNAVQPKATVTKATAARPTRITLDLAAEDYEMLNRWVMEVGITLGMSVGKISQARALRAMIRTVSTNIPASKAVIEQLKEEL